MRRRFLAPGKLVLVGEYAVLDGAPALVAAVNRGVQVEVTPAPRVEILTPGDDDRFARAALHDAPAGRYAFSDANPAPTETKAGFGGSAAATVVGVAAVHALTRDRIDPSEVFAEAFSLHHQVQGSGSGIDVAASSFGGVLRFSPTAATPVAGVPSPIVIWTGQSAKTGPRVERYKAWDEANRTDFAETSAAIVDAFAHQPVAMLDAAWELLTAMARSAGVAYSTLAIEHIVRLARAHGGAAKPSGAGGGDCVVALVEDPVANRDFRVAVARAGFTVIPVALAPGVAEVPVETA
ncbi:MAG: hypothetical protein EP330_12170 [Deltaproteobacteria bacterium]|nr:MAG: hypothetical protein EP330_12170 [Deltaproteobacteria bacterium]